MFERFYYKEALRFLESAVTLDSNFAIAYLYIARIYRQFLDNEKVVEVLGKAKDLSRRAPEKERLSIESLYALSVEKNPRKHLVLLEELVDMYPGEKRFHNELGALYQSIHRDEDAKKEFVEAIRLDPNYAGPANGLSYIYAAQGLYDKAIETQKRYAALSPGDANPFDSMGEIYFMMGDCAKSIASYIRALQIQPSFFLSNAGLAYVYTFNQQFSEGIQSLDNFISGSPGEGLDAWARSWKSNILCIAGRLKEAAKENNRIAGVVAKLKNNDLYAQYHGGRVYNALCNKEYIIANREIEAFQKYYNEDNPGHPVLNRTLHNFLLGYNFLKQGKIDSARSRFQEMIFYIDNVESLRNAMRMLRGILESELLLAEGKPDDAIRVYRETPVYKVKLGYSMELRLYNFPPMRDIVPRAFIQKGQTDSAIAEYERLVVIDPDSPDRRIINPVLHYKLAKLYEQRGRIEKAEKEYRTFLEKWKYADKDQPLLIDAKKSLENLGRRKE